MTRACLSAGGLLLAAGLLASAAAGCGGPEPQGLPTKPDFTPIANPNPDSPVNIENEAANLKKVKR